MTRAKASWVRPQHLSGRDRPYGEDGRRDPIAHDAQNGRLILAPEVEHALEKGDPVIALESTIITHGMRLSLTMLSVDIPSAEQ